jgi:phage gpG-like protein
VRTGTLRSSINTRIDQGGGAVTATVGTNVAYARIHEYGGTTSAHRIMPKKARVLAFSIGGQTIFRRWVNHPGSRIPERSFLRSALAEMRPEIEAGLEQAVAQAVRT